MSLFGGRAVRGFLENLAGIALAALLFAASFPNLLFSRGLPFFAWIAFVPMFWVINRVALLPSVFWGALYGFGAYGLFNYWLSVFHPLAGLIVGGVYLVYFAFLFPLLKCAALLFPKRGYLVQWIIWIGYEYLRTLGFLGYPYGIAGYSQWSVLPLIQIADIFGVWGVSALVVFPSALIAHLLRDWGDPIPALRRESLPALIWLGALACTLIYGFVSPLDYRDAPKTRLALVQHNTDPWRGGIEEYRSNLRVLSRLSREALAAEPKPDLVVWSETAFVPRIYWHITYRDDQDYYRLVRELLDFLAEQEVPFVIGNDDGRRELQPSGRWERVDYNAVLLFDKQEIRQIYRKLHLVPFTEHFPYEKQFPHIYQALLNADTHLWKRGTEATVFESRGLRFSSPICFEDSFGYLSRDFVRNGAELIVNLTNVAWSGSLPAQMQHLSMAVFRAVENRRSMARSTASGQTCGIDPNGRVLAMAEPFTETFLTVELPVITQESLYTRWGDILGKIFALLGIVVLLFGVLRNILGRLLNGRTQ
ncbi:MAG: apolipoprotein N-acyltransferase [Treponema sp.]|jgi:apolipoprotein N-acyltransferase|nr:apolipoprotein N-acyltransferase [Treponema sp.]